ncbi:heavy-metal-associated domain-containing protein [Salinibacterium sp. SWN139]|uniref:heavy-metal-associated domain-containing protein n=1 Tax=Salinibacterium sp. SWN139 TaxID=2792055 RepID=UPI0018CD6FAD|nr:heavy-metal-associated domain-containing protein [Salinibacterium sp. SWN139]MBH0053220.1 heavy-metal-associated domain-containing protein [Salinibacterium sp. SWN139]
MTHTAEYLVEGMTCSHCVSSVTEELSEVDGVTAVTVDLASGLPSTVSVTSESPLDDATVSAAIEEAGYTLVTSL